MMKVEKITDHRDWLKAAEKRARDWYAECCRRSAERAKTGVPTLEEMQEEYQRIVEHGSGEFNPTAYLPDEDALVDAINEEYIASRSVEQCIEQELERMLGNQTRRFAVLSLAQN
jgi:hypothetical protein